MRTIPTVVAGLAAAVSLTAVMASAQPFGGMGPGVAGGPGFASGMGHGFGPHMGMGPGHGPMAGFDPAVVIDSHLTDLKTQLKITAAQETTWQTFASAAKQQAESMKSNRAQMFVDTGTAPERMAQRTKALQQQAAASAAATDALSALYAVLTPEQKSILDQHSGPMAHRGMPFARRAS